MDIRNTIIIGSGPAGWSAAIYTSRAELKPLMFAGESHGGQLMLTTDVENYPGFEEGIMGPELMAVMRKQAERFNTEVFDKNVTKVDFTTRPFKVLVGDKEHQSHSVIITTGAKAKLLGVPGESELMGRGVSTCAVCDAAFYKDKVTFVVGGGDAAMEEALALTKFAKSVTIIHRRDSFRASKIMQRRILEDNKDKVDVMWNTELMEIKGEGKVEKLVVKNIKNGETKNVDTDGVFISIGHKPATDIFKGQVDLDDKGYIVTRLGLSAASIKLANAHITEDNGLLKYPTMTSVEGVFAAGDVVDFRYRQAATAAGYGTMAALDCEWWLEREQGIEVGGTAQY